MAPTWPAANVELVMFLRMSVPSVIENPRPPLISTSHAPPMVAGFRFAVLPTAGSALDVVSVRHVPLGVAAPQ
jgi:hypothetical protein